MVLRKRILAATIIILFFSCKKDKPADTPTVQISAPSGLQTFNVFDTITVKAHVTDAQGLKNVFIVLKNSNSVQVLPPSNVTITSNDMTFTWGYILSDIHLASGQYYLTVTASNGTNSASAYQTVYVNAAPTKRTAVYALTRNSTNVQTWKIDSAFHITAGMSVAGDYSSSDISSYYQQLYIAPKDSGNMNAVTVPSQSIAWNATGAYSFSPYFTNVYSYGDAAYVSYYGSPVASYIKYYSHLGMMQEQINIIPTGYYPIKTLVWGNYIYVEQKDFSSPAENIVQYYTASATSYQSYSLPGPLVGMYGGIDNYEVFLFGNLTNGTPYLQQFYNGSFYSPVSLPASKLISVAQLGPEQFLVGFANGTIYQFNFNPLNFTTYITGVYANRMRYDAVNNQAIIASGKKVLEYNCTPGTGTLAATSTPFADTVLDLQILFNK